MLSLLLLQFIIKWNILLFYIKIFFLLFNRGTEWNLFKIKLILNFN